jgi:hypothetical protein
MTRIRLDQLPAKARARVERQLGRQPRPNKSRAGTSTHAPCPGTCVTCGQHFASAADWEQHVDRDHQGEGVRWAIDLPDGEA